MPGIFRRPKKLKIALATGAGIRYTIRRFHHGDIAQLVERLNGIEKVRGSTPLISTIPKVRFVKWNQRRDALFAITNWLTGNAAILAAKR